MAFPVAQTVEHGACNAKFKGLISGYTIHEIKPLKLALPAPCSTV